MLYRTGNSACKVNLRTHGFPGLTHLMVVLDPACVDNRSGCTDAAAQNIRQLFYELKILRISHAAPA